MKRVRIEFAKFQADYQYKCSSSKKTKKLHCLMGFNNFCDIVILNIGYIFLYD